MTPEERQAAFAAERGRQLDAMVRLHAAAVGEARTVLEDARREVLAVLARTGSEFQQFQLPIIMASIDRVLAELVAALEKAGHGNLDRAGQLGLDLVDRPVAAAGIRLGAVLPEVDPRQLVAMRAFMTDRMTDVGAQARRRITGQLGLAIAGASTPHAATTAIAGVLDGSRARALTITRTEIGRAFSVATQERQTMAREVLPGLRKQWRRSGKVHARPTHDIADGQVVDVDAPFLVGGHELMYPRDPAAPASETVNCGCVQLPFMESWSMSQPGRRPFSDEELARNRSRRDLAPVLG